MSALEIYRSVSAIIVRRLPLKVAATNNTEWTIKDTSRKPTELLYLLVKKPRKNHAWQFPQGGQEKEETEAEAALRELREECGSDLKVELCDKTAIGVYQYRFPLKFIQSRKRHDGSIGAKVICLHIFEQTVNSFIALCRFLSFEPIISVVNANLIKKKSLILLGVPKKNWMSIFILNTRKQ